MLQDIIACMKRLVSLNGKPSIAAVNEPLFGSRYALLLPAVLQIVLGGMH